MDLSTLPIKPKKRSKIIDPMSIFKSLTLRGSIQNVWGPQAEALKEWHKSRHDADVVIGMNTGAGKTLVGLLIAQSLVNETSGKVLYVCPTNQLVEQAAGKGAECGIEVATYMGRKWGNKIVYDRSLGPCVTNYAAVLNGKAIFQRKPISAVVFDDAHVASNFARSQFTLKIPSGHASFERIFNLFRPYFYRTSQRQQFDEILNGDRLPLMFVPTFEVCQHADQLRQALVQGGVARETETMFPWEYLKDHLSRCTVILSGSAVEIAPPLLPISTLTYFQGEVRRVYLTATLPTRVEFLRTFGVSEPRIITPGGKSGDAQRLFLFMGDRSEDEQFDLAKELTKSHKACVLTTSANSASDWSPPFVVFSGANGDILKFAKSTKTDKLVMAARYDGVDLPGDACRIMILDGTPRGSSLFERFMDQSLRIKRLRLSHIAVRITQAIGRIFRSNTDHGAVLVCGTELQSWLSDPENQKYLPKLLQQQLEFGLELFRNIQDGKVTYESLLHGVLEGTKDWDKLYSDHVEEFESQEQPTEPNWFVDTTLAEVDAYLSLWNRDYSNAAIIYHDLAEQVDKKDPHLAAWLRHWEGLSLRLARELDGSTRAYIRAANKRNELGRPLTTKGIAAMAEDVKPSPQAKRIGALLKKKGSRIMQYLAAIESGLSDGSQTNIVEQALEDLGSVLGLQASRPERKTGSGPDVLWECLGTRSGAIVEAKSDKQNTTKYTKKNDIGQFHDHVAWLEEHHPGKDIAKIIAGPMLPVSQESHPPKDLQIVPVDEFISLVRRVRDLIVVAKAIAIDDERTVLIERNLQDLGLCWPDCIASLKSSLAVDLKDGTELAEDIS